MTYPICETFGHSAIVQHHVWGEEKRLRCMRASTARDGTKVLHENVGSDPIFERDSYPAPQRVDGDKCRPDGRHWTPAKELKAI
jgi:hypothetical protein